MFSHLFRVRLCSDPEVWIKNGACHEYFNPIWGCALIEAALAQDHLVTIFHHGKTNPQLFPEVEKIHRERGWGLDSLR